MESPASSDLQRLRDRVRRVSLSQQSSGGQISEAGRNPTGRVALAELDIANQQQAEHLEEVNELILTQQSLKHRAEGLRCDRVTQAALIEKLLKRIQSLSDERKIHVGELARISDTVKRLRIQTEQAEKARVLADDQARMIKGQDERLSDLKKELEIQTERADARARELVVQAKLIEKLEKGTEEQLAIESSKDDKAARTEAKYKNKLEEAREKAQKNLQQAMSELEDVRKRSKEEKKNVQEQVDQLKRQIDLLDKQNAMLEQDKNQLREQGELRIRELKKRVSEAEKTAQIATETKRKFTEDSTIEEETMQLQHALVRTRSENDELKNEHARAIKGIHSKLLIACCDAEVKSPVRMRPEASASQIHRLIDMMVIQKQDFEAKKHHLEEKLNSTLTAASKNTRELERCRISMNELSAAIVEKNKKLRAIEDVLVSTKEKLAEDVDLREEAEAEADLLRHRVNTLEGKIHSFQDTYTFERGELLKENCEKEAKLNALAKMLNEATHERDELKTQVFEVSTDREEMRIKLSSLQKQISMAEIANKSLENQLEEKQKMLVENKTELEEKQKLLLESEEGKKEAVERESTVVSDLKQKLQETETKLRQTSDESSNLQKENHSLKLKLESLTAQEASISAQLEKTTRANESSKDHARGLERELSDVKKSSTLIRQQVHVLQETVQKMKVQHAEAASEASCMRQERDSLKLQLDDLSEREAKISSRLKHTSRERNNTIHAISNLEQDRDSLKSKLEKATTKLKRVTTQAEEASRDRNTARSLLSTLESNISDLRSKYNQCYHKAEALQDKNSELLEKMLVKEQELQAIKIRHELISTKEKGVSLELEAVAEVRDTALKQIAELEQNLNDVKNHLDLANQKIQLQDIRSQELQKRAEDKGSELQKQLLTAQANFEQRHQAITSRLEDVVKEKDAAIDRAAKSERELRDMKSKVDLANQKLQMQESRAEELQKILQDKGNELQQRLLSAQNSFEQERQVIGSKLESLVKEKETVAKRAADLERDLNELKRKLNVSDQNFLAQETKTQELQMQLKDVKKKLQDKLVSTKNEFKQERNASRLHLEQVITEAKSTSSQLENVIKERDTAIKHIAELEQELRQTQNNVEFEREKLEVQKSRAEKLRGELLAAKTAQETQATALSKALGDIEAKKASLEYEKKKVGELNDDLRNVKSDRKKMAGVLDNANRQLEEIRLRKIADSRVTELEAIHSQLEVMSSRLSTSEQKDMRLRELEDEILKLHQQNESLNSTIIALREREGEYRESVGRSSPLAKRVKELEIATTESSKTIKELEAHSKLLAKQKAKLETVSKEKALLLAEAKEKHAAIKEALSQQIKRLGAELDSARADSESGLNVARRGWEVASSQAESTRKNLVATVDELRELNTDMKLKLEAAKKEKVSLDQRYQDLQSAVETEIGELKEKLAKQKGDFQAEILTWSTKCSTLNALSKENARHYSESIEQYKAAEQIRIKQLGRLADELEATRVGTSSGMLEARKGWETAAARAEASLREAEGKLCEARVQNKHLETRLATTETVLSETKKNFAMLSSDNNKAQDAIERLKEELLKCKSKLQHAKENADSQQAQSRAFQMQLENFKSRLSEAQEGGGRLLASAGAWESKYQEQRNKMTQMEVDIQNLKNDLGESTRQKAEVKVDLEKSQEMLNETQKVAMKLRKKLDSSIDNVRELRAALQSSETDVASKDQEIADLKSKFKQREKKSIEFKETIDKLRSQLLRNQQEAAKESMEAKTAHEKFARAQGGDIQQLNREVEATRTRERDLQSRVKELEQELQAALLENLESKGESLLPSIQNISSSNGAVDTSHTLEAEAKVVGDILTNLGIPRPFKDADKCASLAGKALAEAIQHVLRTLAKKIERRPADFKDVAAKVSAQDSTKEAERHSLHFCDLLLTVLETRKCLRRRVESLDSLASSLSETMNHTMQGISNWWLQVMTLVTNRRISDAAFREKLRSCKPKLNWEKHFDETLDKGKMLLSSRGPGLTTASLTDSKANTNVLTTAPQSPDLESALGTLRGQHRMQDEIQALRTENQVLLEHRKILSKKLKRYNAFYEQVKGRSAGEKAMKARWIKEKKLLKSTCEELHSRLAKAKTTIRKQEELMISQRKKLHRLMDPGLRAVEKRIVTAPVERDEIYEELRGSLIKQLDANIRLKEDYRSLEMENDRLISIVHPSMKSKLLNMKKERKSYFREITESRERLHREISATSEELKKAKTERDQLLKEKEQWKSERRLLQGEKKFEQGQLVAQRQQTEGKLGAIQEMMQRKVNSLQALHRGFKNHVMDCIANSARDARRIVREEVIALMRMHPSREGKMSLLQDILNVIEGGDRRQKSIMEDLQRSLEKVRPNLNSNSFSFRLEFGTYFVRILGSWIWTWTCVSL
ncbi:hypothetical protein AAMO2058_000834400 [Amorphochlora amoebiformis]